MKKNVFFLIFLLISNTKLWSQETDLFICYPVAGKTNTSAFGLSFPLGTFNRTHNMGLFIDYSRSTKRYGKHYTLPDLFHFAINGGLNFNPGKTITTAGYESKYGSYLNIYAFLGIDFKLATPVNASLTTGPLLSIYMGNTDIGVGVNLFSYYYISKRLAVGPGLFFRKFGKTDALWSGTIRASYAF